MLLACCTNKCSTTLQLPKISRYWKFKNCWGGGVPPPRPLPWIVLNYI